MLFRYATLSALVAAPIWVSLSVLTYGEEGERRAACEANPTPGCLAETVLSLTEDNKAKRPGILALGLVHLERPGLARLIPGLTAEDQRKITIALARNRVAQSARESAENLLDTSPIVALADLDDLPFDAAIVVKGAYYITALDVLAQRPYEASIASTVFAQRAKTEAVDRSKAVQLAKAIEEMAPALPKWSVKLSWLNVAQIYGLSHEPDAALTALRKGLPYKVISPGFLNDVMVSVQPEDVFGLLMESGIERGRDYLMIARAMVEQGRATPSIMRVLKIASDHALTKKAGLNKGSIEFSVLRQIAITMADLGRTVEAKTLAESMEHLAENSNRAFPWLDVLEVAQTYIELGINSEGRRALENAVSLFPGQDTTVLGVGAVAGPVTFSSWGIGNSAHTRVAELYARTGDLEKYGQHIGFVQEVKRTAAKRSVLASGLPEKHVARLLHGETPRSQTALLGSAVKGFLKHGDQRAAIEYAVFLIESRDQASYEDLRVALMAGIVSNDRGVSKRALLASIRAALKNRNPKQIIEVALLWKNYLSPISFGSDR